MDENMMESNYFTLTDEDGNERAAYCGWQNHFDEQTGICEFDLSVFEQNADGSYDRADEQQKERCYDKASLCALLEQTGFELLGIFGGYDREIVTDESERWYFVARCIKK